MTEQILISVQLKRNLKKLKKIVLSLLLTNHLTHDFGDGRGPDEDIDDPEDWDETGTPQIKFIVTAGDSFDNAPMAIAGVALRPHVPILLNEIVRTRTFEFERSHGAWVINGDFFDPFRDDADPKIGDAERWIIINDSGGWVHPIHIHLEAQQIQKINGRPPAPHEAAKKDTVLLGDFEAEVFIKFRTFPGRFVFHCHNLEHEDMRMMGVFNVLDSGAPGPVDETITIKKAEFDADDDELKVEGKSSVPGPDNAITIYLGSTVDGGTVVGTANVKSDGKWKFKTDLKIAPSEISVQSSGGASAEGITVTIKD